MKKILFIMLVAFCLVGCKSKEEKAEEAIEKHLKTLLYDTESYAPLETEVTEAYLSAYNDPEIIQEIEREIPLEKEFTRIYNEIRETALKDGITLLDLSYYKDIRTAYSDIVLIYSNDFNASKHKTKLNGLKDQLSQISKKIQDNKKLLNYYPLLDKEKIGWNVIHKFRSKNKYGYPQIGEVYYVFSKDFTDILFFQNLQDERYIEVMKYIKNNMKSAIKGDF